MLRTLHASILQALKNSSGRARRYPKIHWRPSKQQLDWSSTNYCQQNINNNQPMPRPLTQEERISTGGGNGTSLRPRVVAAAGGTRVTGRRSLRRPTRLFIYSSSRVSMLTWHRVLVLAVADLPACRCRKVGPPGAATAIDPDDLPSVTASVTRASRGPGGAKVRQG